MFKVLRNQFKELDTKYAPLIFEMMVFVGIGGIAFGLGSYAIFALYVRGIRVASWQFYLMFVPSLWMLALAMIDAVTFLKLKRGPVAGKRAPV